MLQCTAYLSLSLSSCFSAGIHCNIYYIYLHASVQEYTVTSTTSIFIFSAGIHCNIYSIYLHLQCRNTLQHLLYLSSSSVQEYTATSTLSIFIFMLQCTAYLSSSSCFSALHIYLHLHASVHCISIFIFMLQCTAYLSSCFSALHIYLHASVHCISIFIANTVPTHMNSFFSQLLLTLIMPCRNTRN
jgi:hypothetical protein